VTRDEIEKIASEVVSRLASGSSSSAGSGCIFDTVDEAVSRAQAAQRQLGKMTLEERGKCIEAMRQGARDNARKLAEMAHTETGYGHVEHKVLKNLLAANKTPGIEDLRTQAWSGDYGLTLVEMAPFGVIGSITPSTNPPSTIINNSISMIAAGNAVVFNPHPAAKKVSQEAMRILNEAIVSAGGPMGLITTVREPTIDTGNALMNHRAVPLLSITGGEPVVKAAMKTGKKVIAAGPGNPPVIVDDTAILEKAAKDIVDGASFDNNVLCVAEKEVFAFNNITDALIAEMVRNGAFLIKGEDIKKVLALTLINKDGKYVINRN
jgi:propionaldehyde dehydrogenase